MLSCEIKPISFTIKNYKEGVTEKVLTKVYIWIYFIFSFRLLPIKCFHNSSTHYWWFNTFKRCITIKKWQVYHSIPTWPLQVFIWRNKVDRISLLFQARQTHLPRLPLYQQRECQQEWSKRVCKLLALHNTWNNIFKSFDNLKYFISAPAWISIFSSRKHTSILSICVVCPAMNGAMAIGIRGGGGGGGCSPPPPPIFNSSHGYAMEYGLSEVYIHAK